jgi:hypothetical protein
MGLPELIIGWMPIGGGAVKRGECEADIAPDNRRGWCPDIDSIG